MHSLQAGPRALMWPSLACRRPCERRRLQARAPTRSGAGSSGRRPAPAPAARTVPQPTATRHTRATAAAATSHSRPPPASMRPRRRQAPTGSAGWPRAASRSTPPSARCRRPRSRGSRRPCKVIANILVRRAWACAFRQRKCLRPKQGGPQAPLRPSEPPPSPNRPAPMPQPRRPRRPRRPRLPCRPRAPRAPMPPFSAQPPPATATWSGRSLLTRPRPPAAVWGAGWWLTAA